MPRKNNKKVEDKIMDKWGKEESEVLIPAGKNIFGHPTEPVSREDLMMMVAGYVSPFSTVKAAKSFVNLWGAVKQWRGYKLPSWFSKSQANQIIQKTSDATGVPKTKLLRFAKQKVSGDKPSIKENRKLRKEFYKEKGKHLKGSRPPHGQLFGGWKGGAKGSAEYGS